MKYTRMVRFANLARRISRPTTVVVLAVLSIALGTTSARAELILQVTNSTAQPGGIGSFDVQLVDNGGMYQIGGFSVELSVATNSGISFTAADTDTLLPYIFGTYQSAPDPFATDPNNPGQAAVFPLNDFVASDTDFTAPYAVTLNSGDSYGLVHVSYQVATGTPFSMVPISFVSGGTSLSDIDGNAVAFTAVPGFAGIVPAPPSLILSALGTAAILLLRGSRRLILRGAKTP